MTWGRKCLIGMHGWSRGGVRVQEKVLLHHQTRRFCYSWNLRSPLLDWFVVFQVCWEWTWWKLLMADFHSSPSVLWCRPRLPSPTRPQRRSHVWRSRRVRTIYYYTPGCCVKEIIPKVTSVWSLEFIGKQTGGKRPSSSSIHPSSLFHVYHSVPFYPIPLLSIITFFFRKRKPLWPRGINNDAPNDKKFS